MPSRNRATQADRGQKILTSSTTPSALKKKTKKTPPFLPLRVPCNDLAFYIITLPDFSHTERHRGRECREDRGELEVKHRPSINHDTGDCVQSTHAGASIHHFVYTLKILGNNTGVNSCSLGTHIQNSFVIILWLPTIGVILSFTFIGLCYKDSRRFSNSSLTFLHHPAKCSN